MDLDYVQIVRSAGRLLARRSVFFLIGGGVGYAYGYGHASANEPSLARRALTLIGVDAVKQDHAARQRAIDSLRRARMDSIESVLYR